MGTKKDDRRKAGEQMKTEKFSGHLSLKLRYKDRKKCIFFEKIAICRFHSQISFCHENALLRRGDAPGSTIICKRERGDAQGHETAFRPIKNVAATY